MNSKNFNYSLKNIPIPNKTSYTLSLIDKIEHLIKRMRWKAHFFLNKESTPNSTENNESNSQNNAKNTFGFKTRKTPPQITELAQFEEDLFNITKNLKFKQTNSDFQNKLNSDLSDIKNNPNVLVFADKTNNIYELSKEEHEKLLLENITKTYKKAPENLEKSINLEAKNIAKTLNLDEKAESLAKTEAFITLKDHKDNFQNKKPCRLIVPSKSELGHVSKFYLDKINKSIRQKLNLNQWKNTTDVIDWFKNINHKQNCTFIQLDIREFYPSISKNIFDNAINFAKTHANIAPEELRTIRHCRKSLLFFKNEGWKKKTTNDCFDVTMGSFDGAEVCELVGLFILNSLSEIIDKNHSGLYRDDGLIVQQNKNGHELDQSRKKIVDIFKKIGFQIDIEINLKIVNFLDVTFNLTDNSYKPYKKPNDRLLYINTESNHPSEIIKQIPISINKRLNQNSSSELIFNESKTEYEESLRNSGYTNFQLKYNPEKTTQKRTRKRDIIWFNPPFNKNLSTNIGKKFFNLMDRHFPKNSKLHKIFNRNTLKLSYSCTKNMSRTIKSHNKTIITPKTTETLECNCRNKENCPMDGNCRAKHVIYKCVASVPNKPDKVYIGLTEGEWKKRHSNHKTSFKYKKHSKSTALSTYFWETKEKEKIDPILRWSILKSVPAYNNITKRCLLCLHEKFEIISYKNPEELLNRKSELISKCRHSNKFQLSNYK